MIPIKNLLLALLIFSSAAAYAQFRLYEKGHDSYKAEKYPEAIANLTEYLTKSTRDKSIDIDVFYIRALSHYKLNHFQEAVPDFEETLLRGHTNKGNIYWFMAKCYTGMNNMDEAVNAYGNAIRELKDKADSKGKLLYERSQLHLRMNNVPLAYADLREANTLQPSNDAVKKALEQVERLPAASRQAEVPVKDPNSTARKESAKPQQNETPNTGLASTTKPDTKTPVTTEKKVISNPPSGQNNSKPDNTSVVPQSSPQPALSPLEAMYQDEKRYALVIGNSGYPKEIGVLKNPLNDATDMAKELRDSHFDVTLLTDATYGQIRAALMKFKEKLDGGDPEKTVGLFYYAGHGLQFDDENYLVPVDASVQYEDDIPRYCFPINRMVLANMERSATRMNIVILDACRNNPFPSLNRSLGNSGLGEMKRARGSFIAYATSPGSVASDGSGRNGLYTQELLRAMRKPGLTIEQVFKEVRANVLKQSGNKQNTWDSSNIIGEFHFRY